MNRSLLPYDRSLLTLTSATDMPLIAWPCVLLLQNVFFYSRMCSLTTECVLLLQNVFSSNAFSYFGHRHATDGLAVNVCHEIPCFCVVKISMMKSLSLSLSFGADGCVRVGRSATPNQDRQTDRKRERESERAREKERERERPILSNPPPSNSWCRETID